MKSPYYEIIMKINHTEGAPLFFNVTCGEACQGTVELPSSKINSWETITVPVSCLEQDGLDKSKIQIRSLLFTKGPINFDLHSIAIKDGSISDSTASC